MYFTVDKRPDDFLMRVYPYIDKRIEYPFLEVN